MMQPDDIRRDLEPGLEPAEVSELLSVADRLEHERPIPGAAFRGDTGRYLASEIDATPRTRPRRLRIMIAGYAGSGLILLAVALIGVAGSGPLAG